LAHFGLILAESITLFEERINKRRLPVVDVRYDAEVAYAV
jgi:hypothetical protein